MCECDHFVNFLKIHGKEFSHFFLYLLHDSVSLANGLCHYIFCLFFLIFLVIFL